MNLIFIIWFAINTAIVLFLQTYQDKMGKVLLELICVKLISSRNRIRLILYLASLLEDQHFTQGVWRFCPWWVETVENARLPKVVSYN